MPNLPDSNPTIQVSGNGYTPRLSDRYSEGVHNLQIVGNRNNDPLAAFVQSLEEKLYFPSDIVGILGNIGLWISTPCFLVSVGSALPAILQGAFVLPLIAFVGCLALASWAKPSLRLMIVIRLALVAIGLFIGVTV